MTLRRSDGDTSCCIRYCRLRLALLCSSRCERNALRRITFPVEVTRSRLAAPLWGRIFGVDGAARGFGVGLFLRNGDARLHLLRWTPVVAVLVSLGMLLVERAHDHDHVAALDEWVSLDDRDLL